MKKSILLLVVTFGFVLASSAQDLSKNAIGLRLGASDGMGAEISYQRALGASNRIEGDLGWRDSSYYSAFKLTGIYQWVFGMGGKGFNWFVGAGGGVISWSRNEDYYRRYYKHKKDYDYYYYYNNADDKNGFGAFVAGDVGIEYHFDIPLIN